MEAYTVHDKNELVPNSAQRQTSATTLAIIMNLYLLHETKFLDADPAGKAELLKTLNGDIEETDLIEITKKLKRVHENWDSLRETQFISAIVSECNSMLAENHFLFNGIPQIMLEDQTAQILDYETMLDDFLEAQLDGDGIAAPNREVDRNLATTFNQNLDQLKHKTLQQAERMRSAFSDIEQ